MEVKSIEPHPQSPSPKERGEVDEKGIIN